MAQNRIQRKPLLDNASKAIIGELQKDGRKSFSEIGKSVGLSETAVRQRVQKLLDANTMQIVAVTDPLQLGFMRQAMIGIKVDGDAQDVAKQLELLPETTYVVLTAGSFDVLTEVLCESDDDLITLINAKIRPIQAVRTLETFVYLKLQKQKYNWEIR